MRDHTKIRAFEPAIMRDHTKIRAFEPADEVTLSMAKKTNSLTVYSLTGYSLTNYTLKTFFAIFFLK
jgi:hypothetical protein